MLVGLLEFSYQGMALAMPPSPLFRSRPAGANAPWEGTTLVVPISVPPDHAPHGRHRSLPQDSFSAAR
jgi:hypothetical protein